MSQIAKGQSAEEILKDKTGSYPNQQELLLDTQKKESTVTLK